MENGRINHEILSNFNPSHTFSQIDVQIMKFVVVIFLIILFVSFFTKYTLIW